MADAYGKLTGRPGICDRHARPGRDARLGRRAHRLPGLDAADPARRPGRPGHDRPRGVPGDRLPRDVRRDREVGGADRERRARCPEYVYRAFTTATSGRPGRSCSRCRRTCSRRRSRPTTHSRTRRCRPHPGAGRARAPARAARRREAAARDRRRRRVDRAGGRGLPRLRGGERASRRRRVPRQDYVDNASRVYAGHVGIGPDPKLAARVRDADLLLVVGARLGEIDDGRLHARRGRPAAPDARPRPRRRRGARPRLPAGARDRLRLAAVRRGRAGARARRLVGLARPRPSRRTPTTSTSLEHHARPGRRRRWAR